MLSRVRYTLTATFDEAYTQGISGPAENEWFNGPDEYFLLGDNRGIATIVERLGQCRLIKS
ncbi:MAG: hypothetical protein CM1200mP27_05010 [Chloroflexota bacterium]|nr:MAG: hypothetical protein CM1200mP27_05010 [Chloroflexota bacterium]